MGQDQVKNLLQRGIQAARANQPDTARELFQQVIRHDPRNETAWLWLSSVAKDNRERLFCLKQLLAINPDNEYALKGMQALAGESALKREPSQEASASAAAAPMSPPSTVPILADSRYAQLQAELDEFLRHYQPEPADTLGIQWTHRGRGRYGERGAARLKRITYAAAAMVVLLVAAGIVYAVQNLGLFESEDQVALLPTRIPTLTATVTLTPTLGGPTPTPFPEDMAVPATREPTGLGAPGDPFGLASPTAIYPPVNPNVVGVGGNAVEFYSIGDYERAASILAEERERSAPECYASVVYYEALSLAAQQNYAQASRLLKQAYDQEGQRGYASCQGDPLLLVGLAEVAYAQDPASDEAINWSAQALTQDPRLVMASVTKARAELAQGAVAAARATITQAMRETTVNTNLLLVAAEVEMADNQPLAALSYLGQALYIDPALLPALKLQTQVYLSEAAQSEPGTDRQLQYYGLAVRSAQTLLQYYPGEPSGYLLLAQARIGEGNISLAETALTRLLSVEDSLPESARPIIDQAYRTRGKLYLDHGQIDLARSDLEKVASVDNRIDPDVVQDLIDIAFWQKDYVQAKNQLDTLINYLGVNSPTYQLERIGLLVETCTFYPDAVTFSCDYDGALNLLTDDFVLRLTDPSQQAKAFSYRAQARYWETVRRQALLTDEERMAAFQQALVDIDRAIQLRENAVDHYFRGLLLERLENPTAALVEYEWVLYWNERYGYPFVDEPFIQRVGVLKRLEEQLAADQAAEIEALFADIRIQGSGGQAPTATPTRTPLPSATPRPTNTPTRTPEPTATSTPTNTPTFTPTPTDTPVPSPTPPTLGELP